MTDPATPDDGLDAAETQTPATATQGNLESDDLAAARPKDETPTPQPTPQPTTESLWVEKPLSDKEKLGMKLLLTVGAISGAILISSVLSSACGTWRCSEAPTQPPQTTDATCTPPRALSYSSKLWM